MPRLPTRPEVLLYVSLHDPNGVSAVSEHVGEWARASRFEVRHINLFQTLSLHGVRLPHSSLVEGVDVILLHPAVSYFPQNLESVLKHIREVSQNVVIVLYKQDEHVQSHTVARLIDIYRVDIVLTCVDQSQLETVYPPELVGDHAQFIHILTGYASRSLLRFAPNIPWRNRRIDLFYRGSKQPPEIGLLGYQKYALAKGLHAAGAALGLSTDASSEWDARIPGYDWLERLGFSRATAGMESGSNCFDFDGSLKRRVDEFLESSPAIDPWSKEGYARLHERVLAKEEGNVSYGQIAPRHIEAAATRTPQLLLPGEYSGLLERGRHYLELAYDLSNLHELWQQLKDHKQREPLLERAYFEVARRPDLQFSWFVSRVEDVVTEMLDSRQSPWSVTPKWPTGTTAGRVRKDGKTHALVLAPHIAARDPRIGWWQRSTFPDSLVDVLDADPAANTIVGPRWTPDAALFTARTINVGVSDLPREVTSQLGVNPGLSALLLADELHRVLTSSARSSPEHIFLLGHMVRNSAGLVEAASFVRGTDGLVVADLPALPAGLILQEAFDVPLLYDAQEVWAHAQPGLSQEEIDWWIDLEAELVRHVSIPVTVSPGIANWYRLSAGVDMRVVPNFSPHGSSVPPSREVPSRPVRFLFMGNFAPNRGLEQLIQAWTEPPANAVLHLMGPDNAHRQQCIEMAERLGRLGEAIQFPEAVDESRLIHVASTYHVGIVPYIYPYPYSHCSPNKLGQYMAAGCAVLSHDLPFVREVLESEQAGTWANFRSAESIQMAIRRCVSDPVALSKWRSNARCAYVERCNWQEAAKGVAQEMQKLMSVRDAASTYVDVLAPESRHHASGAGHPLKGEPELQQTERAASREFARRPPPSHKLVRPTKPSSPYWRFAHAVKLRLRGHRTLSASARAIHRTVRRFF